MTKKLDDYPEDEHDKDFDLGVAVGATFDYEEYKSDEVVELSVAVRMLCDLGDVEYQWRKGGKVDHENMEDHVLNAIAAKKLNKLDENRVNVLALIQWAKQKGYPIPKQLDRYNTDNETSIDIITYKSSIHIPAKKDDLFSCITEHAISYFNKHNTPPNELQLWKYLNGSDLKDWSVKAIKPGVIEIEDKSIDRGAFTKRFIRYFTKQER